MSKIVFDMKLMKLMSLFASMTGVSPKDCIDNNGYLFIVPEGTIAKAIGKGGVNTKRIEKAVKRKIKIVEFNPLVVKFVQNMMYPATCKNVVEKDGIVTVESQDHKSRGIMIGRNAQTLRETESVVKRYFDIKEIKVI